MQQDRDDEAAETPPQGASSPIDAQNEQQEAGQQWGTLSGSDPQNQEQLGPGPVGPMPAGWPLPRLMSVFDSPAPLEPLQTGSQQGLTVPSTEPLPPPESNFGPSPEVQPLAISAPEQVGPASELALSAPASPEHPEPLAVQPSSTPEVAPLPSSAPEMPPALQEVATSQPAAPPPGDVSPLEVHSVPPEPLQEIAAQPQNSPENPAPLETAQSQPSDPEPITPPHYQIDPLSPLELGQYQVQDLTPLEVHHDPFQEIDVESLLASVQQREEKSYFGLTGIPLLSEM